MQHGVCERHVTRPQKNHNSDLLRAFTAFHSTRKTTSVLYTYFAKRNKCLTVTVDLFQTKCFHSPFSDIPPLPLASTGVREVKKSIFGGWAKDSRPERWSVRASTRYPSNISTTLASAHARNIPSRNKHFLAVQQQVHTPRFIAVFQTVVKWQFRRLKHRFAAGAKDFRRCLLRSNQELKPRRQLLKHVADKPQSDIAALRDVAASAMRGFPERLWKMER